MMVSRVLLFYLCCFVLFLFFPQGIAELLEKKNPRRDFFKVITTTPAFVCILSLVVPATVKKTSLMGIVCHSFTFFCTNYLFWPWLYLFSALILLWLSMYAVWQQAEQVRRFPPLLYKRHFHTWTPDNVVRISLGIRTSSTQAGDNLIQTCC